MPRVLVIDGDPAVGGLFERVLQTAGHSVSLAIDVAAGIEVLRSSTIDLVILDVNMPEREELEVLSLIRRDFPALKVILVSNGYIPLPAGLLLDSVEVLSKPVGVSHLREAVQRLLGYH